MDSHRNERLAQAFQEELEEIINYELSDPRAGPASITEVLLVPKMRQAIVRLSMDGDSDTQTETLLALERARPYMRRLLAQRLMLRRVPDLRFESHMEGILNSQAKHILRRIKKGRPRNQNPQSSTPERLKNNQK